MPGIIGFYPFGEGRENWDASRFLYYGLTALQGRGEACTSIALLESESKKINIYKDNTHVEEFYKRLSEKKVRGFIGIGQVSPNEDDGLIEVKEPIRLVLAGDGKPGYEGNRVEAFYKLAQRLSTLLTEREDPLDTATQIIKEAGIGFSFVALTEREEMICCRDPFGVKPLEVGAVGFDLGIVSSESAALDVVGAVHSGPIQAGECVVFDPLSIRRRNIPTSEGRAYCAFEYVYLARVDSLLNDMPIYNVRERIGEILAEEKEAAGDVVIGIPETALPFALGYSNKTSIPVKLGFMRTGRHVRSALKPTQFERIMGVQLKLNPIKAAVDGKDIILIDDSVVRGNTLKNTVLNLRRKGAKRVHVRVGSPAIISHCPFGTEVPPIDELIGRALSEEEIAEIIGADSFAYLSIEGLLKAIGLPRDRLCLGCFTSEYPNKEVRK
ncbi:MAG: amidophosphoribosyltransferase [Nitrososphaerales archaeon]